MLFLFLFFFKQKTAYELRISDWSSDVCSSDLRVHRRPGQAGRADKRKGPGPAVQRLAIRQGSAKFGIAARISPRAAEGGRGRRLQPPRSGRLEGGDLVLGAQGDADVVEALGEALLGGVVDREGPLEAGGRARGGRGAAGADGPK